MACTTDLSKFGLREIEELRDILTVWLDKGLPEDFDYCEVIPMFNMDSGNVFLTNEDYEVCMLNGNKLESFYTCPECGTEGFADDILHAETNLCCKEYLNAENEE